MLKKKREMIRKKTRTIIISPCKVNVATKLKLTKTFHCFECFEVVCKKKFDFCFAKSFSRRKPSVLFTNFLFKKSPLMDDFQLARLCGPHPSAPSASQAVMLQPTHCQAMGAALQMGNQGTAQPGSLLCQPAPASHSAARASLANLLPRYLEAFQGAQHCQL